jgi:hypothetical protein
MVTKKQKGQKEASFYFYPSKSSIQTLKQIGPRGKKEEERIVLVTELAKKLRNTLDTAGLKKWQVTLEGYIEANTGGLPGGKAGFKASVTLSNG